MIYIITAVHNRRAITESFIDQLLKQTYKVFVLIIVDDGSTDGTSEMIKSKINDAVIIRGNGNLWWGGALHKAYKWIKQNALADAYVMIANDDIFFDSDYIQKAISYLENKQKVLLTGYGIGNLSHGIVDGAYHYNFKDGVLLSTSDGVGNGASTRSLFFKVSDFIRIGGFHPIILPHYGSDVEWTTRACRKYHYTIECSKEIKYIANEETTGLKNKKNMRLKDYFSKRSIYNPFYRMNLILLITPPQYLFRVLFKKLIKN